jgi:hypothetical protein
MDKDHHGPGYDMEGPSGIVTRQGFEEALSAASAVGSGGDLVGLAAPLEPPGWAGSARRGMRSRARCARPISGGARPRARLWRQLWRAQSYLAVLVRGALDHVQAAITVGGIQLTLSSVELVSITADGEVTVSASYGQT